jgi:DNA repair protein RecO (recombination protein O)
MPARVSEAFVLQTYPFREGDLIVSFLTRDFGKLRGSARRARRPKSNFGSGLERLSHIQMSYFQRDNRELVNIDSCALVQSQFSLLGDFTAACALDFFAEVSEQLLPPAEPSEKYFRLLMAVLDHLRFAQPGAVWCAVTYFSLWAVRLAGLLPELHVCLGCGSWLEDPESPERAFFSRHRAGLYCHECRRALDLRNTWEIARDSRALAEEMLHTPIAQLTDRQWSQSTAADLRRFLAQQIETHIERKLITVPVLEAAA